MNIDNSVIIPCPEFGFALRYASHCLTCKHYGGMTQATERGVPIESDSIDMMMVICGRPITRRMQKIEAD